MCFIDRNGYETWYDVMLLNSICFTTVMLPLHRFIRLYLSDLNETDSLSRNGNQRRSNRIRSIAIAHEPPSGLIQRSGEDHGQPSLFGKPWLLRWTSSSSGLWEERVL